MLTKPPILFVIMAIVIFCPTQPVLAAADLNQAVEELASNLNAASQGKVRQVGDTGLLLIEFEGGGSPAVGSAVEVVRPGASGEESIGTAEVIQARSNKAVAKIMGQSALSPQVNDRVYLPQGGRVVVVPFTYNQTPTQFSNTLQDKLVTTMVQKGFRVVERNQLEQVLREQKLTYSGLFDLKSAKSVGKLLGAGEMVLGTIQDQGNTVAINARLVELETADILKATEVTLPKTPVITKELEQALTPSPEIGGPPVGVTPPIQTVNEGGITFTLQTCSKSGGKVTCKFRVTSNEKDQDFGLVGGRIFDENGEEYKSGSNNKLANKIGRYPASYLVADVPVNLIVGFEETPPNINIISLLELQFSNFPTIRFRNITLSK